MKSPLEVLQWAVFDFIRILLRYTDKYAELCNRN